MLPSLAGRDSLYRSSLRKFVRKQDEKRGKRAFGDKDEWRAVLAELQQEGKLTYDADHDEIKLAAAE